MVELVEAMITDKKIASWASEMCLTKLYLLWAAHSVSAL